MKDNLLTPTSTSSSNGRMIIAISLTLFAFLIELYNGNTRILNLNNTILHKTFTASTTLLSFPSLTTITILLTLTLLLTLLLHIHRLQQTVSKSSIPGLPATPHAQFLIGHYGQMVHPSSHQTLFRSSATPSGITSLWGPGLKVCASVLKAEHVRLVLRHTPSRDFSSFVVRHGRKTLGKDSLVLIEGGKEWRRTRNVVQQAFTIGAIEGGRGAVGECAVAMVGWLMKMVNGEEQQRHCANGCNGHKCVQDKETGKDRNVVCLDVEYFFKLFSLDVFGRVTMDYDFECLKKATSIDNNDNHHNSRNKKTCTCFTSPPEAAAFEYLERDIGVRASPLGLLNPLIQYYWWPTKHNREYHANLKLVNTLMEGVIGLKLDEFLSRVRQRQLETKQKQKRGGEDDEEEEHNMITMMLRSVMEQYYQQPKEQQKKQQQNQNNTSSSSSSCPFSSSSTTSFQESDNIDNIIPTTTMTKSDRTQIIHNVSHILHTLLVAGYETTAISLSYTMYCLSKHPRCQDRACEEARRVLPTLNDNTKFDEDALPYCKAVIMETLRVHTPVIFTTRVSSKDLTLDADDDGGMVTIPKDTRFIIHPTMVHLDERNFDRAEEFLPERWVRWENGGWVDRDFEKEKKLAAGAASDKAATAAADPTTPTPPPPSPLSDKYTKENAHADTISAANPQSFFAFSDGARNCIGRRLAIMEMTIFLAVLFRDMCVDLAEEGYELVKERRFVILAPNTLPIAFWKRDE
mmetsp:Transcript_29021/g.43874  ORF Transcript_29021/g.43874 Transcript_29021/m.43874 type:complete len:744 (+) Transcript_29021:65-2296(+)